MSLLALLVATTLLDFDDYVMFLSQWEALADQDGAHDSHERAHSRRRATAVVVGNCGVGFAPVRPDAHDFLIELMEGVEDIPGSALHEGIDWQWESFPEYLDALDRLPLWVNVALAVFVRL